MSNFSRSKKRIEQEIGELALSSGYASVPTILLNAYNVLLNSVNLICEIICITSVRAAISTYIQSKNNLAILFFFHADDLFSYYVL